MLLVIQSNQKPPPPPDPQIWLYKYEMGAKTSQQTGKSETGFVLRVLSRENWQKQYAMESYLLCQGWEAIYNPFSLTQSFAEPASTDYNRFS